MKQWLEDKLLQLNVTDQMDEVNGFTRLSYTEEEKKAHEAFKKVAAELNLDVTQDAAGNLWARWSAEKEDAPTIAVGSHLDTVSSGGGYDGAAGVLTGLAAVKRLKDKGFKPKKNIDVICFASEESARFGVSTVGSKAVAGMIEKDELGKVVDADGISIKEAVESYGLSWDSIDQAEKTTDDIESFLELHIEQGTQIEENGAEIGIVRGVACPVRLQVTVKGMANHTGTTPMHNRSDAFVAAAPLITYVEEQARKLNEDQTTPIVATVSTVHLSPNVMNVIHGEVQLGIDIRSVDDELKRGLADQIRSYCETMNSSVHVHTLVDNDSVHLNPSIEKKLVEITENTGYRAHSMDSGAGHDVMNMATRWPSGLIFIPCREGISHHPREHASIEDLNKGTNVLAAYLESETSEDR
ncbi:M20 family metallo-hydrolase [Halobacillus litoralis]|uniref:M20 family metallo-hydrolase n=1 Tax=Halobacillus litoralis TaxID=45668 RepID=UPI00273D3FB3|nr:M20 family metallo-hydrolase [Halobacillus litoralis]WLR47346.1 M20 family metallo-hydrolase [Halobacillus litoralis]